MSSNNIVKEQPDFSFGTRELRQAKLRTAHSLAVEADQLKAISESRGSDPYNTSGSFDRSRNWERAGRR